MRISGVGALSSYDALFYGATGPILRSTGVLQDLRLVEGAYAAYDISAVASYCGACGDSLDRFLIRSREMFESVNIIYFFLTKILCIYNVSAVSTPMCSDAVAAQDVACASRNLLESLIGRFRHAEAMNDLAASLSYGAVEAGKGEFAVFMVTDSSKFPSRVHLRSPAFNHLQLLPLLCVGHQFADIVGIVGTLDLVFGEVDR